MASRKFKITHVIHICGSHDIPTEAPFGSRALYTVLHCPANHGRNGEMKADQSHSCTEGKEESDEMSDGPGHVKLCFLSQESLIKFILGFIFTDASLACLSGVCLISDFF